MNGIISDARYKNAPTPNDMYDSVLFSQVAPKPRIIVIKFVAQKISTCGVPITVMSELGLKRIDVDVTVLINQV